MSPTKARKGRDRAAKQSKARRFLNLCAILVEDKDFLALISECTDRTILDAYVFVTAQTTEYKHDLTTKTNAFAKVKTLLGTYSLQQLPILIQSLHILPRTFLEVKIRPGTNSESEKHNSKTSRFPSNFWLPSSVPQTDLLVKTIHSSSYPESLCL